MRLWNDLAQLCPTLGDPMDSGLPGSAVHGIFQARILEWAAISFSRGSSQPRDRTRVSRIVGRCFTTCTTKEVCNHEPQLKPFVFWRYSCITTWALFLIDPVAHVGKGHKGKKLMVCLFFYEELIACQLAALT